MSGEFDYRHQFMVANKAAVELLGPIPRADDLPVKWVMRVTVAGAQSFLVHWHCLYARYLSDPDGWCTVGPRVEMNALPHTEQCEIADMSCAILSAEHQRRLEQRAPKEM